VTRLFKLLVAFLAGVATAKVWKRIDVPRELRYLGWSGPHKDTKTTADRPASSRSGPGPAPTNRY